MSPSANDRPAGLVLVGRVAGAFGVRGEVRITSYTEAPLALLSYGPLCDAQGRPVLELEGGRAAKPPELVARARGVDSKEAADALRGLKLHVAREALPPPEEDEFYLHDLIGMAAHDPDGAPLGRIKAVFDHGAGDILELDPGGGRPTRLLPFTREVAPQVDVAARRITLAEPGEVEAPRGDAG
ncbi:MAG: 16S rRNA processing protein RimM [Caulobacteraceae bacterium]|nr:16S rRNA processing protein RimM [Caulobacter sp.]